MNAVRTDFWLRASEVQRYFRFVISAANNTVEIAVRKDNGSTMHLGERDELLKTLKASRYK